MHFNLKRAVGVMAVPLLGSALAVGATALPAHATTWSDTALSAGTVTADTFGGSGLTAADGPVAHITLSGTGVAAWSIWDAPVGITVSATGYLSWKYAHNQTKTAQNRSQPVTISHTTVQL